MAEPGPAPGPRGLGGWLLVPAAGLVLTFGVGIYGIADIATSLETLSLALFYKMSITLGVIGIVVFWIALPATALALLVLHSRHFPRVFVVTSVGLAAHGFLDPLIMAIDYNFSPTSLVYAAIPAVWFLGWSWYMLTSTRVKTTFVN